MEFATGIVLIPLLALLAPLLSRGTSRFLPIPLVVFELVLGILAGPSVLGWIQPMETFELFADLGLAILFFVAGTEIEFAAFRGRTGHRAIGGWFVSIAVGIAVGWLVAPGEGAVIVGVALCSTALGTILPILRDAGELHTPFGRSVGAVGAVGEFGPLVAISLFLGGRSLGLATVVLGLFLVLVAVAIWWASRSPGGALHSLVRATLHTSGQFAIRVVFVILAALVALSIVLGIDMLLGAFAAGIIWRLLMRDAAPADQDAVESKIEAVAFGFFVPIFFIYTGVTFDLASLLADPLLLALLPVGLLVLLLVRGLPSGLAAPEGATFRDRASITLLGATGLPIIVAVTGIGVSTELISPAVAAALVAVGMLSVLVFPLVAMAMRRDRIQPDALVQAERA
ncbi:cation:proton antiporter [Microbacterium caowuchunii]|uniref:cation:proton antiporter n=1 Tax=Microbacterium caowuchunii TaxID=2614638 RepID=UPI0012480256|nr:cation:proton antiporter [Microbacterium caowuchunii]QEV98977.1 cation:proton antiporter [Microbacterium caowuchunii]